MDYGDNAPTSARAALWPQEHSDFLKELAPLDLSCREIAQKINDRFGTAYSRNSIIGRLNRLKISKEPPKQSCAGKPPKQPQAINKPVVKLIASNGNSNSMRIIPSTINIAPIVLRCVEIEPKHVSILDLEHDSCRYPYGDSDFTFCGNKAFDSKPYCPHHEGIVYDQRFIRRWQTAAE